MLQSWPSRLLPRCLRLSSWDGLNLDSYYGPHTFCLRCLCLSSCGGLILDSYHGPHTFCLRCLCMSSCGGLILDSYHGPHTFSWGVSTCRHETVWSWTHIMVLTHSFWGVSVCRHATVSSWTHIMVLTPSVWGVSACCHETVWSWTHIMVLTPSLKVSPPVVMRRSELGLISWSSHLLLRCLRLSSCDGLILDSYHGPHLVSC